MPTSPILSWTWNTSSPSTSPSSQLTSYLTTIAYKTIFSFPFSIQGKSGFLNLILQLAFHMDGLNALKIFWEGKMDSFYLMSSEYIFLYQCFYTILYICLERSRIGLDPLIGTLYVQHSIYAIVSWLVNSNLEISCN